MTFIEKVKKEEAPNTMYAEGGEVNDPELAGLIEILVRKGSKANLIGASMDSIL